MPNFPSGNLPAEVAALWDLALDLRWSWCPQGLETIPRLAGQHREYIEKQLSYFSANLRANEIMHENSKNLTPGHCLMCGWPPACKDFLAWGAVACGHVSGL